MRNDQDAAARAATVAHAEHAALRQDLLAELAGCFPRRESREACAQMLSGLLMELEDKNCWTLAEALGHRTPDRLQHFLGRASWDEEDVLARTAAWAIGRLDDGDAILIVDETADEKSSATAVGAARQYNGTAGGVSLCQIMVTLTFATARGHTIIDRALYLPESWAADEELRDLAGVPEELMFATKPRLAAGLLSRAHAAGAQVAFVTGDEVYGGKQLRAHIRSLGWGYVMAVRSSHHVATAAGAATGTSVTVKDAAALIPAGAWMRLRTGHGAKAARHYDWAVLDITGDDAPDDISAGQPCQRPGGHGMLLIRRHRYTGTLSFYLCWSPRPVPLRRLIHIAAARWRIEEDHQLAKQSCGLDAGQVIRWRSWHRWTVMTLLAYALLVAATALQRQRDADLLLDDLQLIAIAIPELLRQLRGVLIPDPRRDPAHKLAWSIWRRRHQYRSLRAHQRWHTYAEATP